MKILIFETDHYEGSYPVIRLFDNGQNAITLVTTQKCFPQFQFLFNSEMARYEWVVQRPRQSKYSFIRLLFKEIKERKPDIIYLNTVPDNFIIYGLYILFLRKKRIVLTIHDINGYFEFKAALSLRRFVRYAGKRFLINLIKEFNVVSITMVEHLRKRLSPDKKIYHIPGSVFDPVKFEQQKWNTNETINIVVPGTLDRRRRDYKAVFDFVNRISETRLPVQVILLGGYSFEFGEEIIERCRNFSRPGNLLKYYDSEVVDQPEFDRIMNQSHFIWLPAIASTILFDDVTEYYGISICSGILFDVIKHARPFIIPEWLKIPPNIESSSFHYSSIGQIVDFIKGFQTGENNYDKWQSEAISSSMNYTTDKIRKQHPDLFNIQ